MATTKPVPEEHGLVSDGQLALPFEHVPSHEEADFIVGSGNGMAHAHILAWPRWPTPLTLLLGPPQSGKSHLARIWAARSAARFADPPDIVRLARSGGQGPLVLENVDDRFFDEVALFNLLNQSMRDNRSLVITARTPVPDWRYRTEDLRSRVRLAAVFPLSVSDDIELSQMFVKLFGDRQLQVDIKVVRYLVSRMERSAAEVALMVERLDRLALARRTGVTRGLAAEVLAARRAEQGRATDDEGDWDE